MEHSKGCVCHCAHLHRNWVPPELSQDTAGAPTPVPPAGKWGWDQLLVQWDIKYLIHNLLSN